MFSLALGEFAKELGAGKERRNVLVVEKNRLALECELESLRRGTP